MEQKLKEKLAHVVWLGGATDAGKTTTAQQLAQRHGWQTYHYDKHGRKHHEALARMPDVNLPFFGNTFDQRWVEPTPEMLVKRSLHSFQLRLPHMIADLLALPNGQIILVEGFGLLPEQITPLLTNFHQAIWFLPTKAFKLASFTRRGKPSFAAQTSSPEKARLNLLNRDLLLADLIKAQVKNHGCARHTVDGTCTIEDTVNLLDTHFSKYLQYK